jgi:hypothetical protein
MIETPTIGLTNEVFTGLSANHEPPCLPLYQPT